MNLYRLKFNKFGYDQYDSFVVLAENEDKVVEVIKKEYPGIVRGINYLGEPWQFKDTSFNWEDGFIIEKIKNDRACVLLGSFNAG